MATETCWTMIGEAARGDGRAREAFAIRYLDVVRSYVGSRWRGTPMSVEIDDAVQEVFVRCYRNGGILEKVERGRPGGFQAFLHGVVRNVAREFEATRRRNVRDLAEASSLDGIAAAEDSLVEVFDRSWAQSVMNQARRLMAARANAGGDAARRRIELLRLRFEEDRPIRAIAVQWGEDAARLHHEFARARKEFDQALRDSVVFHGAASPAEIEAECRRLLSALA
jgi:RNA polymerase sigma-70 factor (ECF subfamily)